MTRIAFIGLGNMGRPMSRHLVAAGHAVTGYDLSERARAGFAADGGAVAGSVTEAIADAEAVITMIPAGPQVRAAYEGPDGIIARARPGTLLIDCSTIDVESSRAVNRAATAAGFDMVDAPVSGAVPAAEAGTLTFMMGGSAAAVARARPILKPMGRNHFHVGGAGMGHAMKICNNMMAGMSMVAISEVFVLADKLGLERQAVYDVMTRSSGNCWALQSYCPVPGPVPASPANRDYAAGFAAAMMLKDMRLSQQAAGAEAVVTPLAAVATSIYQLLAAQGGGHLDFSAVFPLLSGQMGAHADAPAQRQKGAA